MGPNQRHRVLRTQRKRFQGAVGPSCVKVKVYRPANGRPGDLFSSEQGVSLRFASRSNVCCEQWSVCHRIARKLHIGHACSAFFDHQEHALLAEFMTWTESQIAFEQCVHQRARVRFVPFALVFELAFFERRISHH